MRAHSLSDVQTINAEIDLKKREKKEGHTVASFFYNQNNHLNDRRTDKDYSSFILMYSLFYLMM
jgi:hypothetical protein